MNFELEEKIRTIAAPFLRELSAEIVEMKIRREARRLVIEILADKPAGGITISECTRLNRKIGDVLEVENTIGGEYILEVSSPGLDRPLKTKSDFNRVLHKEIKFFLTEPIEGKWEYQGELLVVNDEGIIVAVEGKEIALPLNKINQAKQNITIGRMS